MSDSAPRGVVLAAACLIVLVQPLYLYDGFNLLVDGKFVYLAVHVAVMAACLGALVVVNKVRRPSVRRVGGLLICPLDIALATLLGSAILSTLFSPRLQTALLGHEGRDLGLVTLVACCALYAAWRLHGTDRQAAPLLGAMLLGAAVVSLLGLANFFRKDPFSYYTYLAVELRPAFLSTLGNRNTMGQYLCLLLPLAAAGFALAKKLWQKGAAAGLACLLYAALLASASEGALLGLAGAAVFFCCQRAGRVAHLLRLLPLAAGLAAVGGAMGLLTARLNPDSRLDGVFLLLVNPAIALAACAALAGLWLVGSRLEKRGSPFLRWPLWPVGYLAGAAFLLMALWLVALPWLAAATGNNTLLPDAWGAGRGFIWKTVARAALGLFSPLHWVVGYGPDTVYHLVNPAFFADSIVTLNAVIDTAHSDYLQALAGQGMVGLLCWLAVLALALGWLLRPEAPRLGRVAGLAVAAYAAQGLVGVANPMVLPLLYLLLGVIGNQWAGRRNALRPAVHKAPTSRRLLGLLEGILLTAGVEIPLLFCVQWLTGLLVDFQRVS